MTEQATIHEIRGWAGYLRQQADALEATIPEVEKISGKVKVPGKTFGRVQEEIGRLIVAIKTNTLKDITRMPFIHGKNGHKRKGRRKENRG